VTFYVYGEDTPSHSGPIASIDIVNVGKLPGYITTVVTTEKLPWVRRWPVVRSVSFRARHRRGLRWLLGKPATWYVNVPNSADVFGRLDPGEYKSVHLAVNDATI
jgi:hypothetical protein